jgi:hypothetical protein
MLRQPYTRIVPTIDASAALSALKHAAMAANAVPDRSDANAGLSAGPKPAPSANVLQGARPSRTAGIIVPSSKTAAAAMLRHASVVRIFVNSAGRPLCAISAANSASIHDRTGGPNAGHSRGLIVF